ncbi:hypothetical protein HMPREF0379_0688 [[Eubacterium] yurii subsp. margaretiae ATCC 43715]|nr:hypothetical protein HMPREF0379_0688 [[Eubacterium] yurii subsp. margaretiae ATCC 43715]
MKKKYFIILVDILTIILIILHAQALSLMIIESFQYYSFESFFAYMLFYYLYGIIGLISESNYKNIFLCLNFLIYILNINILYNKYRDIRKKNSIFSGKYKYTIIINILFVVFKTLQYFIIITIIIRFAVF